MTYRFHRRTLLAISFTMAGCGSSTSSVEYVASLYVESLNQQDFDAYDQAASKGSNESFASETGCLDWSTAEVQLTETPVGSFINATFTDEQGVQLRRVIEQDEGEWSVIVLDTCDDGF